MTPQSEKWVTEISNKIREMDRDVIPQTQEWIAEINKKIREAEDAKALLKVGVAYLRCQYVPEVVKACWKEFAARMAKFAPEDTSKSVVAVDLPAIFHAAFSGLEDSPDDAVASVKSRVEAIYSGTAAEDRSRFICATDGDELWRRAKFPGYKAKRPPKHPLFKDTLTRAIEAVQDMGYVVLQFDGEESDDILASISYSAKLRKQSCVLVTDDRDSWQCLGMGTVMYSPRTHEYTNEERLATSTGITPKQAVDWLCLVGKNDVPNAKGIGEKNASELLGVYGNFWGIFDNKDNLTPAKKTGIEEFAKSGYWMARELHTLNKGLEVWW